MFFLNYQKLSHLFAWHNKMKNITFVFFMSLIGCCCINLQAAQQPLPKVLVYLQGKYNGMPGDGIGGLLKLFRDNFPGLNFVEVVKEELNNNNNEKIQDAAALIYAAVMTARLSVNVDWDYVNLLSNKPGFSKENVFVAALIPGSPEGICTPSKEYEGFNILPLFYLRYGDWIKSTADQTINDLRILFRNLLIRR